MTTHSTTTTPAPAARRRTSTLPLLGVAALTAIAVLALFVWQRSSESEPAPPPAPVAAAPLQTIPPFTFYLVETADDAAALDALLEGAELALVAGTAAEQQRAYAHIELMQVNVPDREVLVIDRRSS